MLGTQALCEAATRAGVERFHHVSTCEVYGDLPLDTDEMFTEDSPYRPRTPYNASKAGGDHVVRELPRDVRAADHDHELLEQLRAVPVPGEGHPGLHDRRARRPAHQHVRLDAEQARVAARPRPLQRHRARDHAGTAGETYNVGSGLEVSIEELADLVLLLTGKPRA